VRAAVAPWLFLLAMTGERHIDYEALAQDALRKIVRTVLVRVAKSGLPGDHHFYISFSTSAPGVSISPRLRERYPEEMTIVLQHRFWDLIVGDERFEVKLTFDSIPEKLVVPFAAIKVFFDPSVPYGLQFEGSDLADTGVEMDAEAAQETAPPAGSAPVPKADVPAPQRSEKKAKAPRKPRAKIPSAEEPTAKPRALPAPAGDGGANRQGTKPKLVVSTPGQPEAAANDTKVVQLDKFRKK
jgi:uncharacterized protein